ncbi:MAG: hypothetical protein HRU32_10490 [Rhodobacteraceae bacterium]|nr:hypothetical protein [Paracoccaceae bacterium]
MITILVNNNNRHPIQRLVDTAGARLPTFNLINYQDVFTTRKLPVGCVIFTDFDLLTDFQMDAACTMAVQLERSGHPSRILNDPRRVLERFDLLRHLYTSGQNAVEVTRLKGDVHPQRYPLFLRMENGATRPDTDLIHDPAQLALAKKSLASKGHTLRGRMTVSFEAERDLEGFFRKYGVFRIGDHLVPQHILRSPDWIVKSNDAEVSQAFADEELKFVEENPHASRLTEVFEQANITFGRIDYTVKDGEVTVFEINTNPVFPRFIGGKPEREMRRGTILDALSHAFASVDIDVGDQKIELEFSGEIYHHLRDFRQQSTAVSRAQTTGGKSNRLVQIAQRLGLR